MSGTSRDLPIHDQTQADRVLVDGIYRPRHNSRGLLIHATEQGVINFWRWFGDSQTIDAHGRPLVAFHGTDADFASFCQTTIKSRFPLSFGFHFTDQMDEASVYADSLPNSMCDWKPGSKFGKPVREGANVRVVYLQSLNPLVIHTRAFTASVEADLNHVAINTTLMDAKQAGRPHDAVLIHRHVGDEYDHCNVIVFDAAQIKSAIGNSGRFDPLCEWMTDQPDVALAEAAAELAFTDDFPMGGM